MEIMRLSSMILGTLSLALVGCAVKNPPIKIEPAPYQVDKSKAYNIAAQTVLTRPYKYGLTTYQSPLKDFTQEEIEEAKTALTRNVGGVSKFFGVLSIMTGNFTGLIDVVGGSVAGMATSDHIASQSRWIVAVEKNKFKSAFDAESYIKNTIQENAIKTLFDMGFDAKIVSNREDTRHGIKFVAVDINKKLVPYGLTSVSPTGTKAKEGLTTLIDGTVKQAYTIGFNDNIEISKHLIGNPFTMFAAVEMKSANQLDSTKFYQALTAKLPQGFYLYVVPFEHANYESKIYGHFHYRPYNLHSRKEI